MIATNEINSEKNQSMLYHKMAMNIIESSYVLNEKYDTILQKYRLSYFDFVVLEILAASFPTALPMFSITNVLYDKKINVSRKVNILFLMGLLTRIHSEKDRRVVDVLITNKGVDIFEKIKLEIFEMENSLKNFGDEKAILLKELLDDFKIL